MSILKQMLQCLRDQVRPERRSEFTHAIILIATCVGVLLIIAYYANAGELRKIPLDFSVLDDANPARIEVTIEKATVATFLVMSIEGENDRWDIKGKIPNHDDVRVTAHVSRKDAAKVNIGDLITVRGEIRYMRSTYHNLTVGYAFPCMIPPGVFHAKVEEIIKN